MFEPAYIYGVCINGLNWVNPIGLTRKCTYTTKSRASD